MSPALVQLLIGIAIPLIPWVVRELQALQAKRIQSKALDAIEDAAASVGVAALKAGGTQAQVTVAVQQAAMAAMPNVADALQADIFEKLTAGHVAQLATAPGGSVVAMPSPAKA